MPRRRTIRATLARPARCTTPLFRPPSTYSPTSISRSSPEHSANAPSPSVPLAAVVPCVAGARDFGGEFDSVTRNRYARANRSSAMADHRGPGGDRGLDRSLGLDGHADDDVLDGLRGGHADFHDKLA